MKKVFIISALLISLSLISFCSGSDIPRDNQYDPKYEGAAANYCIAGQAIIPCIVP